MRKLNGLSPVLLASLVFGLSSCEKEETNNNGDNGYVVTEDHQYVIAAGVGENSYLLQANGIEDGSVSTVGNGIEVLGSRSWYFYKDFAAYSFLYSQGDPGVTSSYTLDQNGYLQSRQELGLEVSIQSRGIYKNNIIIQYSSRSYTNPVATFYKVDVENEALSSEIAVNTENFAGNGEMAYFTDFTEYQDKILAGFRTISGGADTTLGTFGSLYTDSTYLAVFDENLNLERIIRDGGRTGQVAGQARSQGETGIEVVDNGDVYVFSSAIDDEDVPSGVLKINAGSWDFDPSYFFNISQASGGQKVYRVYYMGGKTFVLHMFDDPNTASASPSATRTSWAVLNLETENFQWVTGLPADIDDLGTPYIDREENRLVLPVTATGGSYPHLYLINPDDATATQGIEVVGESVLGIGKLTY